MEPNNSSIRQLDKPEGRSTLHNMINSEAMMGGSMVDIAPVEQP